MDDPGRPVLLDLTGRVRVLSEQAEELESLAVELRREIKRLQAAEAAAKGRAKPKGRRR